MNPTVPVASGLDVLAAGGFQRLKGRRVGLIANPTTVDRRMRHLADLLRAEPDVELVALFGPEHGVRGDAQDMIGVESEVDRRTGVPVHSLYGSTVEGLSPTAESLTDLDVLIFDVQDVGSRYYTFAATMAYAMAAAARQGIEFLVLDRPNPIGGVLVEGPTVSTGFESFVGFHPLPIRHGLTVGELAGLVCSERKLDLNLVVIPCEGWNRSMYWSDTGLSWVAPSPNMPTPDTALVYPGGCLIEGTNLSEGRGTTRPFENWGAPWLDLERLESRTRELLDEAGIGEGVDLRPNPFRPTFHKHANHLCLGLQPHVFDRTRFRPVAIYSAFLAAAFEVGGELFAWRTEPYEFVENPIAIDLLFGSSRERLAIEAGLTGERLRSLVEDDWKRDETEFLERRRPFLIYPE